MNVSLEELNTSSVRAGGLMLPARTLLGNLTIAALNLDKSRFFSDNSAYVT